MTAPVFRDGLLKVFRNTLTNDLRFHCRVDRESETYWSMVFLPRAWEGGFLLTISCPVKASNAQLVPAYAYDQRLSNVVYIRDKESDKGTGYMQASQGNYRPSGIYQFSSLRGISRPITLQRRKEYLTKAQNCSTSKPSSRARRWCSTLAACAW